MSVNKIKYWNNNQHQEKKHDTLIFWFFRTNFFSSWYMWTWRYFNFHPNHCYILLFSNSNYCSFTNNNFFINNGSLNKSSFFYMNSFKKNWITNSCSCINNTAWSKNWSNNSSTNCTTRGYQTIFKTSWIQYMCW